MLNQDFKEFIESCNANGVRYLVVGGYALALHGRPRYTKDLDVWIDATVENAECVVRALRAFGIEAQNLTADDFIVPDRIIQFGVAPNRIDLLTSIPGVQFGDCYAVKNVAETDGVSVDFIDEANFKRSKLATGRMQDLADVELLESDTP